MALLSAREILADAIKSGREDLPDGFVIANEQEQAIDVVPLAAALPKSLKR